MARWQLTTTAPARFAVPASRALTSPARASWDCDLRQVKIADLWLVDVSLSGLVGNLVVNDVDVTAFVEGELDRRLPERIQLRAMRTADDYRAMWDTI